VPPVADEAEGAVHVPAAADAPAPADVPTAAQPPARGRSNSFDELAFLSSVVDTPGGAPEPAADPPSEAPARRDSYAAKRPDDAIENLDATAGSSILGVSRPKGTPMAANISGNNPIVLRDRPAEGSKSLKCADCGAMNFPTEWYCERCGAELASL
jgi:hypothetical protein